MAPPIADAKTNGHAASLQQPITKKIRPNLTTDPFAYDIYHQKFISDGRLAYVEAWILRAQQVRKIFAIDAAAPEALLALMSKRRRSKS